jgi:hypothetical protein
LTGATIRSQRQCDGITYDTIKKKPREWRGWKDKELVIYDTEARLLTRDIQPGANFGTTQDIMLRDPRHSRAVLFVKTTVAEST